MRRLLLGPVLSLLLCGASRAEQSEDSLLSLLQDKSQSAAVAAAQGLGELRSRRAVEPLMALSKRGGALGAAAFEALGRIKDKKALPAVRAGLAAEKTLDKIPAAYALARISGEEGEMLLEGFMDPGPEGDAPGVLAARYLAALNRESGLDFLGMLLGADHNPAQLMAAEALGLCGNQKAVLPLAALGG